MNPTHAARLRLRRLLSEPDFRADDLTQLFLYARDRCQGRESVQEIGDFVAHHDERNRGPTTRAGRDFFLMLGFTLASVTKQIQPSKLPANFPQVLDAVMRAIDHRAIKERTGISKSEAVAMLPNLAARIAASPNQDGTLALPSDLTPVERKLIICLTSVLIVRPAFTDQKLFEDFRDTLRTRDVLHKGEAKAFERLRPTITLYAMAAMHRCTLRLGDGAVATLKVGAPEHDMLAVLAYSPETTSSPEPVGIGFAIFSSSLPAAQYLDLRLAQIPDWGTVELEVTPNRLLGILG